MENKVSSLEKTVIKILSQESIFYIKEKTFPDLHKGLYRFDFYLPNYDIILEIQGAQHYEFVKAFYKKREDFLKAQERDRKKISYCLAHDIKLYCIPYWEIENLGSFSDLLQDRFLAKTQFHNDNVFRLKKNEDKIKKSTYK